MKTLFIGLGHYSGVGKDESAKILQRYLTVRCGLSVRTVAFADKLKELAYQLWSPFGMRDKAYYEIHRAERYIPLPELGKTPVELWVMLGTPWARATHDDIWVRQVAELDGTADIIIVPDTRFLNETAFIQRSGGLLYKVERRGVKPLDTVADQALVGFGGWDDVIANHGDMNQLRITLNAKLPRIQQQWQQLNSME